MKNNNKDFLDNINNFSDDEVIDVKKILSFTLRNKKFIGKISFIFFLLSFLFTFTTKNFWQGQFQIVLNMPSDNKRGISIQGLGNLSDIMNLSELNNLKTEVGILESPSILMPIYEFAISNGLNKKSNSMSFMKWKNNNLRVKLEKGTSILNITYKDRNKENIIPVLNRITSTYQEYSGRYKRRKEELTKSYLENQISLFQNKSSNSLKKAQEFAIDQDLIYIDTRLQLKQDEPFKKIESVIPNVDIETTRVQAANQIRKINMQIKKINELGFDYEKLQYIGSTIPGLVSEGLPIELAEVEKKLVEQRLRYKENDETILRIIQKRDSLVELIKERSIGFLKAQKVELEALMESAMRPKGVLLTYKELIREAARDESTLITLENQLRNVVLIQAKVEDPWELITRPTLLKNQVGSSKILIVLFGTIFGFFSGIILSFIKEKKSNLIYESESLEEFFLTQFTETFFQNEIANKSTKLKFVKEYIKTNAINKLYFISLGSIDIEKIKKFKKTLLENDPLSNEIQIIQNSNFYGINKDEFKLLFVQLGKVNVEEIKMFVKYLKLSEINLSGLIIFED